ncbi:MAG TPA: ClbS/DfsB family four-helix bundle protein [Bacteroidota bacterium]
MGRRLRKKELLEEIQQQRTILDETLALVPPRFMTKAGVTRGGWSVKDILAHLVEWQQMNLNWYAAGLRGEKPAMPAPGYTLREIPRLNEMIYRKHHRRPLQDVLHDYKTYHERVVTLIISLPDSDLVTLQRFSWTGPSWTLSDYLRASTAAHYLWAYTRIRRWWRTQTKSKPAKANRKSLKGKEA